MRGSAASLSSTQSAAGSRPASPKPLLRCERHPRCDGHSCTSPAMQARSDAASCPFLAADVRLANEMQDRRTSTGTPDGKEAYYTTTLHHQVHPSRRITMHHVRWLLAIALTGLTFFSCVALASAYSTPYYGYHAVAAPGSSWNGRYRRRDTPEQQPESGSDAVLLAELQWQWRALALRSKGLPEPGQLHRVRDHPIMSLHDHRIL